MGDQAMSSISTVGPRFEVVVRKVNVLEKMLHKQRDDAEKTRLDIKNVQKRLDEQSESTKDTMSQLRKEFAHMRSSTEALSTHAESLIRRTSSAGHAVLGLQYMSPR